MLRNVTSLFVDIVQVFVVEIKFSTNPLDDIL